MFLGANFALVGIYGCAYSEWSPGLQHFNILFFVYLCSPPPDAPSSSIESNLPVSHPTPAIQIVGYVGIIVRQTNLCYWTWGALKSSGRGLLSTAAAFAGATVEMEGTNVSGKATQSPKTTRWKPIRNPA